MSEESKIPSRVSITYSVDTQEVPDRVKLMMEELANSFGTVARLCREAANKTVEDAMEGTRALSDISTLIKKTNIRVEDCMDIMIGYLQILQASAAAATEAQDPPQEEKPKKKTSKKKKTTKKTTKKASKKKED